MLFLGAGASKPFGIPTMSEFTQEIPKALQDDEAKEFKRILDRLGEFGFPNPDIESVMDVLTARADLKRAKKSIGPRLIEFVEKELNKPSDFKAGILLDKIKEQIEARCSKASFSQSNAYYKKFFQSVPTTIPSGLFRQIFTTNYDRCLEEFLENRQYEDGFEQVKGFGGSLRETGLRPGVHTWKNYVSSMGLLIGSKLEIESTSFRSFQVRI